MSEEMVNGELLILQQKRYYLTRYDDIDDFSDGLSRVKLDDRYGFIDKKGKVVIPLLYDNARAVNEGLCLVRKADQWGTL